MADLPTVIIHWQNLTKLEPSTYTCGHCGKVVGPSEGYYSDVPYSRIYVCPFCHLPTYFDGDRQMPGPKFGSDVGGLPDDIAAIYQEARDCMSVSGYTAAVMLARKLLMNVAVGHGAAENLSFVTYVEYLADQGYVPPNGKAWVDRIRSKGNEANHEIRLMSKADAEEILSFVEMLLKFVYEFPSRVPGAPTP